MTKIDARTEIENAILEYAKAADAGGDAEFADLLEVYGGVIAHAILTALAEKGYVIEQGWQPIETAPRDGTLVCLWTKSPPATGPYIFGSWSEDEHGLWSPPGDGGCWKDSSNGYPFRPMEVSHWRPLPEPPARGEG